MTNVSIRSVSKVFGDVAAVQHVDLEVKRGEFVVLLGPSGCGKTTTLRMVAGFDRPTSGQILLGGQDVTAVPPRLRNIGMVFQNYALFPNMTVGENIAFGLKQRRAARSVIEARVAELLDLIRLPDRRDHYPGELSGGQQQRVALARALSYSPQVLLMDEPLGALDLKLREDMQVELRRIQRDLNITTMLVTHDQQEAMTLADRIVIMADGRVQQNGTPDELYYRPANKFVANFVGKNNVLDGEIVEPTVRGFRIRLATGSLVEAASALPHKVGARVDFAVRPENLRIDEAPNGADRDALIGTVEQRQFLGNIVYYFVRLHSGATLMAERPGGLANIALGTSVRASWEPAHAVVFAAAHGGR